MPTRIPRPCAHPRCPKTAMREGRCTEHASVYDNTRPCAAKRGYDRTWVKLRAQVLAENPVCERCPAPSREVDHIDGNSRNNERSNLRALCKSCHSRRTAAEQSFGKKVPVSSEQRPTGWVFS